MTTTVNKRRSPIAQRLKPAAAALLGLLVLALNAFYLVQTGQYFPFGTLIGAALLFAGSFGAVVGEPEDPYGNRPMWFTVGVVACGIVGVLLGLLINTELSV